MAAGGWQYLQWPRFFKGHSIRIHQAQAQNSFFFFFSFFPVAAGGIAPWLSGFQRYHTITMPPVYCHTKERPAEFHSFTLPDGRLGVGGGGEKKKKVTGSPRQTAVLKWRVSGFGQRGPAEIVLVPYHTNFISNFK